MFMLISTHQKVLEDIHSSYKVQIDSLKSQIEMLAKNNLYNKSKLTTIELSPPNCCRDAEFNRLVGLNQASSKNHCSDDDILGALAVAAIFETSNNCDTSSYSSSDSASSYSSNTSSSSSSCD